MMRRITLLALLLLVTAIGCTPSVEPASPTAPP